MKIQYKYLLACFLPCLLIIGFCAQAQDFSERYSNNILTNPSFENGEDGWQIPEGLTSLSDQSHSGAKSLEFNNPDPSVYKVIGQKLSDMAGKTVHFSAWAKAKNVQSKSSDRGVFLYVEAYDATGKYLGGAYRQGFMGTFDWTYLERTYRFPVNTAKAVLGIGMRKGTTGTAWFDDINLQIENHDYSPVKPILLYPNYRGITTKDNKAPWEVLLKTHLPSDWPQSEIQSTITDSSGKVLSSETIQLSSNSREVIRFYFDPANKITVGKYNWKLELTSKNTQKSHIYNFQIDVKEHMPSVYIDHEGFTIVDGKRFFPFGVYLGGYWSATDADLKRISAAGLNTILSYQPGMGKETENYLDRAHSHNLHVIYSLKDMHDGHRANTKSTLSPLEEAAQHIKHWANNPSLLAWYINDELSPQYLPQLQQMYDQAKTLDPNHPAYQVVVKYDEVAKYYPTTDAWGTDPYPISGTNMRPIRYVGNLTRKTVQESHQAKSTWEVLQIFDNSVYTAKETVRPPTLKEMRNMSYQALINGAKGILYYSYYDLYFTDYSRDPQKASLAALNKRWPDVQKMTTEIASLIPVILKNEKVLLDASPHQFVQYQVWQDSNKLYLLVVNTDSKTNALSLQIPPGWCLLKQHIAGVSAELNNNTLHVNFESQASGTLILQK